MQKELTQSEHPTLRKRQKRAEMLVICCCPKSAKFNHILDVFSSWGGRIKLIPFALSQASGDTSLDYPQGVFWRQKISDYFDPIPLLRGPEKK